MKKIVTQLRITIKLSEVISLKKATTLEEEHRDIQAPSPKRTKRNDGAQRKKREDEEMGALIDVKKIGMFDYNDR